MKLTVHSSKRACWWDGDIYNLSHSIKYALQILKMENNDVLIQIMCIVHSFSRRWLLSLGARVSVCGCFCMPHLFHKFTSHLYASQRRRGAKKKNRSAKQREDTNDIGFSAVTRTECHLTQQRGGTWECYFLLSPRSNSNLAQALYKNIFIILYAIINWINANVNRCASVRYVWWLFN